MKRWVYRTKNAGEVHSDEKAQGLINRLKEWNSGDSKLPKMTNEDGELKTGKEHRVERFATCSCGGRRGREPLAASGAGGGCGDKGRKRLRRSSGGRGGARRF